MPSVHPPSTRWPRRASGDWRTTAARPIPQRGMPAPRSGGRCPVCEGACGSGERRGGGCGPLELVSAHGTGRRARHGMRSSRSTARFFWGEEEGGSIAVRLASARGDAGGGTPVLPRRRAFFAAEPARPRQHEETARRPGPEQLCAAAVWRVAGVANAAGCRESPFAATRRGGRARSGPARHGPRRLTARHGNPRQPRRGWRGRPPGAIRGTP